MSEYGDGADIASSLIVSGATDLGDGDDYTNIDKGTLFIDGANNRVGVGTTSPSTTLHISGSLTLEGSTREPALLIMDDEDASAQIGRAHIGYDGADTDMAIFAHQDNATPTSFAFRQRSNGQTEINAANGRPIVFKINSSNKGAVDLNGNFGMGTTSPNSNAILELSSSDQGMLLPRVLSASKPTAASALNGLMIYEEDTHLLKIVANGEWKTVSFED
jgi:hypothetical protein